MCGIVGYIGPKNATPIILNGLKKLEYRGYDSAGIAVIQNGKIEIRREAGKLSQLNGLVNEFPLAGSPGIGHTRWATHGVPSARNAHPHLGATGRVVVVHNGIVENYLELRDELTAEGVIFNRTLIRKLLFTWLNITSVLGLAWKKQPGYPSTKLEGLMELS